MGVRVSVASFDKGFPKDLPVPERLLAFADWVKKVPRSRVLRRPGIDLEVTTAADR